ncbi:MAG TPA: extracellular solute-binding protein [Gemmatimonadales bacterium]|nr:extracellular solute-binding protein [Gemmatimonadales bacterium]
MKGLFAGATLTLWLASACTADHRTPLVIYSPHGRDLLSLFQQQFERLHPDVSVHWLDMGSQDVYDRLRSERANPQADVWFGGPATIFARGVRDSLLDPFRPSWAADIAEQGRGPGDRYFAAYLTPAVLVYAAQALTPAAAPQDWDDLLAARWTGRVLVRDPLASGTMRAVWGMIIERGLAATGDTAAGFAWLRRLDGQTKEYVLNGTLLDQKLVRQEGLVSIWDLPDILLSQRDGLPLGYTFPTSGTPVIEDAIGVVRGAQHRAAARAFVEWVGSREAELLAARRVYRLPARLDLPLDSLPPWAQEVHQHLRAARVDWDLLAAHEDDWMRVWDETVRGKGRTTKRGSPTP